MLFLILFSSFLISVVAILNFRYEAKEYHNERLTRKETAIKEHINYVLQTTNYSINTKNIPLIFKDKIYELSDIHSFEINFFDTNGKLLISSQSVFKVDKKIPNVKKEIIDKLKKTPRKSLIETYNTDNETVLKYSYSFLKDNKFKNIAILNLPYEENNDFYNEEVEKFLLKIGQVYLIMLIITIFLSYLLSKNITFSLTKISDKIEHIKLNQRNEKLSLLKGNREINNLVEAYNNMIDELEKSASQLAQNEREFAWREMAKQVAHEIKNPLTPMRLTIQSFQRKFDPNDPDIIKKLNDYTNTLIQQIDTMSAVASAFSSFASMPAQQNESINFVEVAKVAVEIFNEDYIIFESNQDEIIINFDKTQLIRIVNNLVKNAQQAIPEEQEDKMIKVTVKKQDNFVVLEVSDNGIGIDKAHHSKIFEPQFTTKSSGMGLGLAMIKNIIENYNGTISLYSKQNQGATFRVEIPLKQ